MVSGHEGTQGTQGTQGHPRAPKQGTQIAYVPCAKPLNKQKKLKIRAPKGTQKAH